MTKKKANRKEWLAQKRKQAEARAILDGSVEESSSYGEDSSGVNVVAPERERRPLNGSSANRRSDETRASADLLPDSWRWDGGPCSSPEPPVSHSWRLFDSHPREIWYGGIVLLHAYCITCGGLAKFSEGAWETTVALGDGPCVEWAS